MIPNKLILGFMVLLKLISSCSTDATFSGKSPQEKSLRQDIAVQDAVAEFSDKTPDSVGSIGSIDTKEPEKDSSKPLQELGAVRLSRKYPLTQTTEKQVQVVLGQQVASEIIDLKSEFYDESRLLTQDLRPLLTQFFKQGSSGEKSVEFFNQKTLGILDLLIVVDNSGSMDKEQDNLAKRLSALLQHIDESDWRINVVTTDPKDGCSRALLKKGDPDLMKSFEAAVTPGIKGSGHEEGIRMSVEGLSCKGVDWVRPNSSLAILMVSDEDNCSLKGEDCKGSGFDQPIALTDHLEKKLGRVLGKTARFYGIFWEPGTKCSTGEKEAFQYSELVKQTKGQWGSICDLDYTATLKRISADVSEFLTSEVELKNTPDTGSLKVFVNKVELTGGYRVENKKLIFEKAPPYQATIEVRYSHGATPVLKRFPIAEPPALETMQVVIKGKVVDPAAYSFDEIDQSLVFIEFPEDNVEIKFQARKRLPLKKDFEIGGMPDNYTAKVTLDGRLTTKFKIELVDGVWLLRFEDAPKDGQKIVLALTVNKGPILEYPLSLATVPGFDLDAVVDAVTGQGVKFEVSGYRLKLDPDTFISHKKLKIVYLTLLSKEGEFILPDGIQQDQVKILGDEATKACQITGSPDQDRLFYLDCTLPAGFVVNLGWSEERLVDGIFELDIRSNETGGLSIEDFLKTGTWSLKIDGLPIADYSREGQTIRLPSVPAGAKSLEIQIEVPGTT